MTAHLAPLATGILLSLALLSSAEAEAQAPEPAAEARASGTVLPQLEWVRETGAESCVTAADLSRMLARVLGERAAPSALGDAVIEGLVARGSAPVTWRCRIRIVSPDGSIVGQRELTTRQPLCAALTPSVLLVLLMLVDPESAALGLPTQVVEEIASQADAEADAQREHHAAPAVVVPSAEEPLSTLPLPPPPPPSRVALSSTSGRESSAIRGWRLHLEPIAAIGLVPATSLGVAGGVALVTRDDWQLALSGSYGGRARVDIQDAYAFEGGVVFTAVTADLSVCPALLRGSNVGLSACLGATFVRRSTDTPALEYHRDPSQNYLGPSAGVEASVALTEQWHLRAHTSAAMPIPRGTFVYQTNLGATRPVYTPPRFFGVVGIGLGAEL